MSLRKSPELTPALLAAARQNAQHSTGPCSAAGKQSSKLNALKHGVPPRRDQRRKPPRSRKSKFENRKPRVTSPVSNFEFRFSSFEFRSLKGSSGRKRA